MLLFDWFGRGKSSSHYHFVLSCPQQSKYKGMNKDQWYNVLEFSRTINTDLSNYDEDGACKLNNWFYGINFPLLSKSSYNAVSVARHSCPEISGLSAYCRSKVLFMFQLSLRKRLEISLLLMNFVQMNRIFLRIPSPELLSRHLSHYF